MGRIYVALDLETTGLSREHDQIIEIGAVKFRVADRPGEAHEVLDTFVTLVNPGRRVSYSALHFTGISQEELDGAPTLEEVLPALERFVGNYPVVGHSIDVDLRFLHRHGALVGTLGIDTFELASILLPEANRYSLGKLADHLGIEFPTRHRALDDAEMARRLFVALWDIACGLPQDVLKAIVEVAMKSEWPLRSFFANALRVQGVGNTGAPQRAVRRLPPIPDPLSPRDGEIVWLDAASLERVLDPDGPLAAAFANFERRPQQRAMLRAVAEAFNDGVHLLVEAGTGTGKSLAYLIPALHYALEADEPVVISTNTINLQEQLYRQDIPRLVEALGLPVRVTLLKGRTNYVCPARVREFMKQDHFSVPEARLLARVLVWLFQTETGDRSELLIQPDELPVWPYICSDSEACKAEGCSSESGCFFYRARALAQGSHLVIVNHALLLSDLALENAILPAHRCLVVDEAHHLEDRATEHLGGRVSRRATQDLLYSLVASEKSKTPGLLVRLRKRLQKETRTDAAYQVVSELVETARLRVNRLLDQTALLFSAVTDAMAPFVRAGSEYDVQVRLVPDVLETAGWHRVADVAEAIVKALDSTSNDLYRLMRAVEELDDLDAWESYWNSLLVAQRAVTELAAELNRIVLDPDENDICWVRLSTFRDDVELRRAPLHVGSILQERLFRRYRSVVLTSATLQSHGGFAYIRDRLGLDGNERVRELTLGSPFNYREMALVYVPTDLPEPNRPHYARALEQAVADLARATGGRMLVLCTSKSQLRRLYQAISDPLARDDIVVLAQYVDGSRRQLVERFKDIERCVLLGTQSFWEGVDVPGDALSCLVITRLPFPVPDDPVFAARAETYSEPFYQFTVPQAILRFRQGFGRLIRTQTDRGIVAIFDSRISSRRYGQHFLDALPSCEIRFGPVRNLPPLARRWLEERPMSVVERV